VNLILNAAEARVLGSLIEKDITTPDYYPLSLNVRKMLYGWATDILWETLKW
jgi:uncharacterized protein YceH (UPF0502 family)